MIAEQIGHDRRREWTGRGLLQIGCVDLLGNPLHTVPLRRGRRSAKVVLSIRPELLAIVAISVCIRKWAVPLALPACLAQQLRLPRLRTGSPLALPPLCRGSCAPRMRVGSAPRAPRWVGLQPPRPSANDVKSD